MLKQFQMHLINLNLQSPTQLIHNPYEIFNLKQEFIQKYHEGKDLSDSQVPIQFVQTMQDAESTNDIQQSIKSFKLQQNEKEYGSQQLDPKTFNLDTQIKSDIQGSRNLQFIQDPLSYIDSQSQNEKFYDEEAADEDLIFSCFRNSGESISVGRNNFYKQKSVGDFEEFENKKEFVYKDRTPQVAKNPNPVFQRTQNYSEKNLDETINDPSEYVNPLFLKVIRKSKVIYARWFDQKLINLKMLFNIFSTYGNIEKMIYLKERSSEYAKQAKEYLNNLIFYGQSIKIFFSNYDEIFLKSEKVEIGQFQMDPAASEEYFQGCEDTHRFKVDCNYPFLPPSDTISISNMPTQSCPSDSIKSLFEKYGSIEKIKFLQHKNNKNICYIKFDSCDTALKVLANMHGSEINGRIIHIVFARNIY